MSKTVISLGGSVLLQDSDDVEYIKEISSVIVDGTSKDSFIIVVGGGITARRYIGIGREIGADESTLDWLGIQATRLNAFLLISALGDRCYPEPFGSVEEAIKAIRDFPVVVGGGTHPGHTTDTVAALIAERWGADLFVNLTAVDGVYTADPEEDNNAERIPLMTTRDLLDIVAGTLAEAGSHSPMDPLASKIIHRSSIKTAVIDGRDIESVRKCLTNKKFRGTMVNPGGDP